MFSSRKSSAPASGGYTLSKSLRFRNTSSPYLNRTPASVTNQKTWTFSAWIKIGLTGNLGQLFSARASESATYTLFYNYAGKFTFLDNNGANLITNALYIDPSAWYHLVLAVDTTQATSTNSIKLYVNGTQVTSFSTATYPTLNANLNVNNTVSHNIGAQNAGISQFFDGYITDVYLIDGQQLTPSSFASTNATTGQWSPAIYSGSYGTNGFHLTFTNTTSTTTLGYDTSGNSNNWTTNNISLTAGATYDSMNDVPVAYSATAANYCVMNPNDMYSGMTAPSNGNLKFTSAVSGINRATIAPSSGKWYFEITFTTLPSAGTIYCGVKSVVNGSLGGALGNNSGTTNEFSFGSTGYTLNNGASTNQSITFANGDVMNIAFDLNAGYIWFGKNGTWILSGNPATGANPVFTTLTATGGYAPAISNNYTYANTTNINFGQQPFTYTPPSGYNALNTYNLPTPTIAQGNKYMDATLYTGTGASASITNSAAFKPDLVWIKSRSAATDHKLTDSVRGVTKGLISDTSGGETTDTQGLTAFNSNGFTLGTDTNYNNTSATYVGWQWQAGAGSSSSNTNGSITSTVSASTTAGFSVVTWTVGTGVNTVGHGLVNAPAMVISKRRNSGGNWIIYHSTIGATQYVVFSASSAVTDSTFMNNTAPTSTVFTQGSLFGSNGDTYVSYCFAQIAGFSAFGSYTGNGNATGPFIYTGFQPKYIMVKCYTSTSGTGDWLILDENRNPYNTANNTLFANSFIAENTSGYFSGNFLSNGFQITSTNNDSNLSGEKFIYMAFASNPFVYSNAF